MPTKSKTKAKSKATKGTLNKKQLAHLEKRLHEERARVMKELGYYGESFNSSLQASDGDLSSYSFHMADQGTDAMEREKAFLFASQEGRYLWHVPEVAALLRREQERLLPLHGVGPLVRHVERVAREIAVGGLEARVEGLAVIPELLHHPGALFEQALLEMRQLLLVEALARLRFGFGRHYRVPPFRPSWRRSAMVTRRASMSTSRVRSASANTSPKTTFRASVSPATKPWNADTAATMSSAPATLSSMRVVYSYPASLRSRCTRFTNSRASPSCTRSCESRGSTAATYGPSACTAQSLTTSRVTVTSSGCSANPPIRTGSPRSS